MSRFLLLFVLLFSLGGRLYSQCTPPATDLCEDANVLCGLDAINGYSCTNPNYSNPSGPTPLCPTGGAPHNLGWWAFTTMGGFVQITVTFGTCQNNQGVQIGIYTDCTFSQAIDCNPNCNNTGSIIISGNLDACKTYYLFVDGCNGDVCDFTLTTSGGSAPSLGPIGKINNNNSMMDKVCLGHCNYKFMVNPQPGNCSPYYEWTMDGSEFGDGSNMAEWPIFDTEGMFEVCVKAIIGNPANPASICDEEGPVCMTITVEKIAPVMAAPRTICNELSGIYRWHDNVIFSPGGTYSQTFTNPSTCCIFDSIAEITVLDEPVPAEVYHIGCTKQDVYIDYRGVPHPQCGSTENVFFPKSTETFKCDSSINLHQFLLDAIARWRIDCIAGAISISPEVDWSFSCFDPSAAPNVSMSYKWYYDFVGNGVPFSTDEIITVTKKAKHCLEVTFTISYGDKNEVCTKDMGCEPFDEDDLLPKGAPLDGMPDTICIGNTGTYFIDSLLTQKVIYYTWNVEGGDILTQNPFGKDTISILWTVPGPGRICLIYETNCGISPETCIPVFIVPAPNPYAGLDKDICQSLQDKLDGTQSKNGSWTVLSVPNGGNVTLQNPNDPKSNIDVNQHGSYTLIWTESINGCTEHDTVTYDFNAAPTSEPITYLCNGNRDYRFTVQVRGNGPFTLVSGDGVLDLGGSFASNPQANNTGGTIVVRDVNGCLITVAFNKDCQCTNAIGQMQQQHPPVCENQQIQINYDPTLEKRDLNDTLIFILCTDPSNPLGTSSFVKFLTSTTIAYDPSLMYGTQYYVVAYMGQKNGRGGIDPTLGCAFFSEGQPVQFIQIPSPDAGADNEVCGLQFTLIGNPSITGSGLRWEQVGAPTVVIADPTSSTTDLTLQGAYGTYTFRLTETNSICENTDEVRVTFNENPSVINIELECVDFNDPDYPYSVKAKLSGGNAPYILLQGAGSIGGPGGDEYFLAKTKSLDSFYILVQDSKGCISELAVGTYNCNCGIGTAGTMPTVGYQACEDQCITFIPINDDILLPEDTKMYVMHESNSSTLSTTRWDTIRANEPYQVCFKPGMVIGKTYYISRVVGNDTVIANGIVDIEDPCKRISEGVPVVWYPYPNSFAGPDTSVCGRTFFFDAVPSLGTGSWRMTLSPSGSTSTIQAATSAKSRVDVSDFGVYVFEWTEDNQTCLDADQVTITFLSAPTFDGSPTYECDNTAENYRIRVNVRDGDQPSWDVSASYAGSTTVPGTFTGNTWTSDWIPQNSNYKIDLTDKNRCALETVTGSHFCPCLTRIGTIDTSAIVLCADGTANASTRYNAAGEFGDANDTRTYVLHDNQNIKSSTALAVNPNGTFTFNSATMQYGRRYFISYVIGNSDGSGSVNYNERCFLNVTVPVIWYKYPEPDIAAPQTLTCVVRTVTLNGTGSKSNANGPLNYNWSKVSGAGNITPSSGTASVDGPGTFRLQITDVVSGCISETTVTVDQNIVAPAVEAGPNQLLTCKDLVVDLNGSGTQVTNSDIIWTGPTGSIIPNTEKQLISKATQPGFHRITVVRTDNGCTSVDSMLVSEDKRLPSADIAKIGDLTCTVRQIDLSGTGSTGQAGAICNFNWRTTNGNIVGSSTANRINIDREGTYILEVVDCNNGCKNLDTLDVKEIGNPLVRFEMGGEDPLCTDQRNGKLEITGVRDVNGVFLSNLQYSVNGSPFASSGTFSNLGPGTYNVTVKDINGCLRDTVLTLINPAPVSVELKDNFVVDQGTIVNLDTLIKNATDRDEARDEWLSLLEGRIGASKLDTLIESQDYTITTYNEFGCPATDNIRIVVKVSFDIWWPNAISPDGQNDPKNNKFNLFGKRVRDVKVLDIYDRWGEKVFHGENLTINSPDKDGWDGTFRGKGAMPGVYVFYGEVTLLDGKTVIPVKGDFTLLK